MRWAVAIVSSILIALITSLSIQPEGSIEYQQLASVVRQSTSAPKCIPRVTHRLGRLSWPITGVLLHKTEITGWVITAGHLFTDGLGQIEVNFGDGKKYEGKLAYLDKQDDFALIRIAAPPYNPCKLSSNLPKTDDILYVGGYPRGGAFRWIKGRFRNMCRMKQGKHPWIDMTGIGQGGDSGGLICNEKGELVAILSSTNKQHQSIVGPSWNSIKGIVAKVINGEVKKEDGDAVEKKDCPICPPGGT